MTAMERDTALTVPASVSQVTLALAAPSLAAPMTALRWAFARKASARASTASKGKTAASPLARVGKLDSSAAATVLVERTRSANVSERSQSPSTSPLGPDLSAESECAQDPRPVRSAPRGELAWMGCASAKVATVASVAKYKHVRRDAVVTDTATKKQLVVPLANANVDGLAWGANSSHAHMIQWKRRSCLVVATPKSGVYARRASVTARRSGVDNGAPNPLAKIAMTIKKMGR